MSDLAESLEPSVPVEEVRAAEEEQKKSEESVTSKDAPVEGEEVKQAEKPRADKFVKIQALDEQKHKRRAAESEVQRLREQNAVMMDRLNQIVTAQNPQNQVDPNDPIAVHDLKLRQTEYELAQLRQRQQSEDYQRQQSENVQGLVNWAQGQATEFLQEKPDFAEAYKHVATNRAAELKAMGLSQQEVRQAIIRDEIWVYEHAHQTGKNPAEVIYQMALNTGYKAGSDGDQKIGTLQRGLKASQNIGTGGTAVGRPTPEQIAAMSDEQFDEFKRGLSKKGQSISDVL